MGKIYLSSKGLRPDIDNSTIINRQFELAKDKDTPVFPDGKFPTQKTILQENKGLRWESTNGNTELMTALAVPGVILKTNRSQSDTFITGIDFVNHYGGADNTPEQHGIISSVILNMSYCKVQKFWGNGIVVTGDIAHRGVGSNASFSFFDRILISENRKSGMYFQGGDANKCSVTVDVRDNLECGIWDNSFLGNQFYGCMAHNNGERNYKTTDVNNRAGFWGCYSEGGSPPDSFAGVTMWFGGFPPADVFLYDRASYWYGNQVLYADKNNPGKYLTRWSS